jgi:peptidoglycan/LPS O-acetylase OafA/YrhL
MMKKVYSPEIDCLRGLAVIAVMLYHLPYKPLSGGLQGVTIFFVISGFLMAKNSERAYQSTGFSVKSFYFKRIKRIYPFLVFSLLFIIILAGLIDMRLLGNLKNELPSLLFGYNNWWQLHEGVSYFDTYLNSSLFKHYWSLAVELQFYLMWPYLFILLKKLRRKHAFYFLYALLVFSIILNFCLPQSASYYNSFARLFSFVFGVWGYFNAQNIGFLFKKNSRSKIWLLIGLLLLLTIFPIFSYLVTAVFISGIVAFLLAALDNREIASATKLANTGFFYIGKISYELYLVHYSVLIIWANLVKTTHKFLLNSLGLLVVFLTTFALIYLYKKMIEISK